MPVESDLFDDDPVLVQMRAARPVAPSTLEADVLARLGARPRSRVIPLAVGSLVACVAIVCAVLLFRDRAPDERVAAPPMPIAIDAGTIDAPSGPWSNLASIWAEIDRERREPLAACLEGPGSIGMEIRNVRDRNEEYVGAQVSLDGALQWPVRVRRCLSTALNWSTPNLPYQLNSITLVMAVPAAPLERTDMDAWQDPVRTVHRVFDANAKAMRACVGTTTTVMFFVIAKPTHAKVWVPRYQFPKRGDEVACFDRLFETITMPRFPPILSELQVEYRIVK